MALPWEWILALFFSGEQHPSSHQTDMGRTGCLSAEKNVFQGSARATARVKGKRWDLLHRAHLLWSTAEDTGCQRHHINADIWTSASPALVQGPFTRVCNRLTSSASVYSHFYHFYPHCRSRQWGSTVAFNILSNVKNTHLLWGVSLRHLCSAFKTGAVKHPLFSLY